MNLKWLFWTGLLAIIVFFSAIYFGIKYDWVSSNSDSNSRMIEKSLDTKAHITQSGSTTEAEKQSISESPSNGVEPELIDEIDVSEEEKILGAADLTIEEVVSQCQSLSESIGIPQEKLEQAISECVDRNSWHLSTDDKAVDTERAMLIREQCNVAITQKDLLSTEEIKLLVDECVASMSTN